MTPDAFAEPPVAAGAFQSWCVHPRDRLYVYLYGPRLACRQALAELRPESFLHRRDHATLEDAQMHCEAAAAQANGAYGGLGQARVLPADRLLGEPGLLARL